MKKASSNDTVFVIQENQEHCFVFPRDDPIDLHQTLFRNAEELRSGITREEAIEVLEGIIPERIRSI